MPGGSIDGVTSFVPARVARQQAATPPPHDGVRVDRFEGAILMADISGFTMMAEALARRGAVGAEDLTRYLNIYFGRLIDLIVDHGGDILKFAGDALLAAWPAGDDDLPDAVRRAAQCGLAVQAQLHDFPATDGVRLSLRVGVGAGTIAMLHVGGVEGRRELVITGDALAGMNVAAATAKPGELGLAADAFALVREWFDGEPLQSGVVRIQRVREAVSPRPLPPLPNADWRSLLPYVPTAVVDHLGRGEASWLAELRNIAVLFVNFPGLMPSTPLHRAQAVMEELQTVLHRFEGTINKVSVDDKGASLVAAFGLPPLSHDNDPERAVRAAIAIDERLDRLQVRHSTGIATGLAFCGVIGNTARREYTMIGDVVNLAARLMQAAKGGILCDRATADASRPRLAFEALPAIHVKGKAEHVAVFRPVESETTHANRHAGLTDEIVGREREIETIEREIDALVEVREGGVIVFEGMAGIGKSRILDEIRSRARGRGVACLEGRGDSIEKATAFYAWRAVFEDAFGLDAGAGLDERQARVSSRVTELGRPEWIERLPLLDPVLRTGFPPTETTASLDERARAAATYEYFAELLIALAGDHAPIVMFDDAHFMDSASLALASRVVAGRAPLLVMFALRPIPGPAFDEIGALSRTPGARRIDLAPLGADDAVSVASRALGVSRVPEEAATIVRSRSEGNPLLCQEIAIAMRDAGLIRIVDGQVQLVGSARELTAVDLPSSLQGAITARLDRLSSSERLLVKLASVVGRVFETDVVVRLSEGQLSRDTVLDALRSLDALRITSLERAEPGEAYAFTHLAFAEVAYHQMLFAQRRQMHRAMAELLEERHAGALSNAYPLLAFHWQRVAEDGDAEPAVIWKAVEYLQKAGEQALQQLANPEAIQFLDAALRLLERLPEGLERSRKELTLCATIGTPLLVTKGFAAPETERAYSRAMQLCHEIQNSPEQFGVVYGLWGFALMSTQLGRAHRLAAEVYRLAEVSGDLELMLPAERAVGDTAFWLGELPAARLHLERAFSLYRPEHHAREVFRTGQDQGVVSSALSAWAVWLLGYPDTALTRMERALTLAERLNHLHTYAMTLQNDTMTLQFRGEAERVLERAEAQLALARKHGFPLWEAGAAVMRGWAWTKLGRMDEGLAEMRRGIDGWRATGAELAAPYYLSLLAEAQGAAGQVDRALDTLQQAFASSNRSGEAWWRPEICRLDGELRLLQPTPDLTTVERCFVEALVTARAQTSRSLELRAACSLLRLDHRLRQPTDGARATLTRVLDWFTEGRDTADLRNAAALL